jgi:UDP-N-acetylglucosamine:LPS N-acetylglucosamine transferase
MLRPARMKTIDLVYFNAGGGHRAAATALEAVIRAERPGWQPRLVNLVEVLDPKDRFRKFTGIAPEDIYNKRLAKGWTLGLAQELKLLQGMIRLGHTSLVRALQQHWLRSEPDMVVSLVPNFNRALYESVAGALPGVPYVTVLTDLADHPPNFWIEPGQAQWLVCGTPRAVAQARAAGYGDAHIRLTSGMILRPDFYTPPVQDRAAERAQLGLDPAQPVGVVMFGGQGSMAMRTIGASLPEVPLILLCGHHRVLADELRRLRAPAPRIVVEFTPEVQRYMRLGDFFIGKPGPGALTEAVRVGLPVVTTLNAWTMPQERYNAQWARDEQLGAVCRSLRTLPAAVHRVIADLPALRQRVARIDNRAVFELPHILEEIFVASGAAPRWQWARHARAGQGSTIT